LSLFEVALPCVDHGVEADVRSMDRDLPDPTRFSGRPPSAHLAGAFRLAVTVQRPVVDHA